MYNNSPDAYDEYLKFTKLDLIQYFEEIGNNITQFEVFPNKLDNIVFEKYRINDMIESYYNDNEKFVNFTDKGHYFWEQFVKNFDLHFDPF